MSSFAIFNNLCCLHVILDTGFWILDKDGFFDQHPASSIQHRFASPARTGHGTGKQ
jgi:hypothetical protein